MYGYNQDFQTKSFHLCSNSFFFVCKIQMLNLREVINYIPFEVLLLLEGSIIFHQQRERAIEYIWSGSWPTFQLANRRFPSPYSSTYY